MSSLTADTLITRARRFLRDWPQFDALTAGVNASATSLSVADSSKYSQNNQLLELDQEIVAVTALADATTLTVRRAQRGTTGASHASGATLLMAPRFFWVDYLDALNAALDATFPYLYQDVVDTTLSTSNAVFEYTIPTVSLGGDTVYLPYLHTVELFEPGDIKYREARHWKVKRGATPKLIFKYEPLPNSTIRISGISPMPHLAALTDTLPTQFPTRAESVLPRFMAEYLLSSGEAYRVRTDTGALDDREQATRPGSSQAAANANLQRFYQILAQVAMPPPAKHLIPCL